MPFKQEARALVLMRNYLLKQNQLFSLLSSLKTAYVSSSLESFLQVLAKSAFVFGKLGANRCYYICYLAENIIKNPSMFEEEPSLWDLYPAFLEFLLEYIFFIEYSYNEEGIDCKELRTIMDKWVGPELVHHNGEFYCLKRNQTIEVRDQIKQKTCIIPPYFLKVAEGMILTKNGH